MRFFERVDPGSLQLANRLVNSLSLVSEYKGKQNLFKEQSPEKLEVLRQAAIVQSTESSNRIEQVTASPARIIELMSDKTTPKNRSEQEIVGYRKVLQLIHENYQHIPIAENTIKQFHRDLFWYNDYQGGKYKVSDNTIIRREGGIETVVFQPTPTYLLEPQLSKLHQDYNRLSREGDFHPLLLTASYVLDFLCIHPFSDGNGRIGRLMTLLLLYQHGYEVGAYISLERIIEETKESYYETLNLSSRNWHENKHDPMPWIEYFVGVLMLKAYREFEERVGSFEQTKTKGESVVLALHALPKAFKFSDVKRLCPHVSDATIKSQLTLLKKQRLVKCSKQGRDALWEKTATKFWDESIPAPDSSELLGG